MNPTTITSRAAAGLVAAVAGFASYRHIYDVATNAGEHQGVAAVLPLSIDGLIVVGTMAMLEDKRAGRAPRPMARVALAFGIVATIAANVASAQPTMTARLVAAVPALAFLIAVEVLARVGRPLRVAAPAGAELDAEPEPVVDPWTFAEPVHTEPKVKPEPAPARPVRKTVQRTRTTRTAAAGKPVPPRVLDMVRALDAKYPGPIPGRRTVMDETGWKSVGDVQSAINLLKAERAKAARPVHLVPDPAEDQSDRAAV